MYDRRRKRRTMLLAAVLLAAALPCRTGAVTDGGSYTYTSDAQPVPDKAIYEAARCVTGEQAGAGAFSQPEDLFIYGDEVYVADTGNDRIVVLDKELRYRREIADLTDGEREDSLSGPTGVFVGEAGILVCDQGNQRALLLDGDGRIRHTYLKPDNETLAGTTYKPVKAVMDDFHNVYILANGVYQGFLQFTEEGDFQGFFGSNVIESSLSVAASRFWKNFFSKEASETMARDIPVEYSNAYMDPDGFLYATIYQTGSGTHNLKKLNARGANILQHSQDGNAYDRNLYGDQQTYVHKGIVWKPTLVDVTVDGDGLITVLDSTWCRAFQYDQDGNLIGVFGGNGDTMGRFAGPVALEHLGDACLVLDKLKGSVTVFEPTQYRRLLGQALRYYGEGAYGESIDLWQEVLKYQANNPLAYRSIGKAYMQQARLGEALQYLHMAGDRESYSLVLGQLRQRFFQENILWILLGIAAAVIGLRYAGRALRRWMGFAPRGRKAAGKR